MKATHSSKPRWRFDMAINVTGIAFSDSQLGIGAQGDLLIREREDMRMFREFTRNKILLVGRKTFESLPCKDGFCLSEDRLVIVISRQPNDHRSMPKNAHWLTVPAEFYPNDPVMRASWVLALVKTRVELTLGRRVSEVCVIGGGEIYRLMAPVIDLFVLNRAEEVIPGCDTWLDLSPLKCSFRGGVVEGVHCKFRTEIYQQ